MGLINRIFAKDKNDSTVQDGERPLIFIIYSSYDKKIALDVCSFLESHNVKCLIFPRDAKPDMSIEDQISDAINNTEIVLFISSENSIGSRRVEYQINIAVNLYKTVLRFNIDQSRMTGSLEFLLMNNQFIDAYPNPEEHFDDLLVEVSRLIDDSSIIEWGKTEETGGENIEGSSHEVSDSKNNKPKASPKPFKAYDGDGPYIFISYKHADTDLILPILKRFTERGYNIWFDQGLQYGDDYDDLIDFKIDGSSLFVIFITETVIEGAYNPDEYMKKELDVALDTGTKIFPIFLQDVGLKGKYRMHLRGKHSIFLHEYASEDEFIDDCITAFRNDFGMEPSL